MSENIGIGSSADQLDPRIQRLASRVIREVTEDYGATFTLAEVAETYVDVFRELERNARVTVFLPLLGERLTRQRLAERAARRGLVMGLVPYPRAVRDYERIPGQAEDIASAA
ncbi:hypothetical protein I6A84_35505 [Frankia sp. CNm7]|uniref:Uncharacterized protein n=1 Tax=Frankia nepalensis TaxID=1836974 RepID=A0A937UR44_9ACTN|nr:hypothetical protein [Frankia nepalensis]MBL7497512.1 hypothetical protein [Frankia nepalensis]MBL7510221.1 hypothetical protein [Frankia nepalensis]MBL7523249.1 hypothetical protein [Frankia nepalensis]MBL7630932.1 hypothetical protein [Frankia nepalensis]